MRPVFGFLKQTVIEFIEDGCPTLAAALAYYTAFSLPPLLLIVATLTSKILGPEAVQSRIYSQVLDLAGRRAATQVSVMLEAVRQPQRDNLVIMLLSVGALAFAATTAFTALQGALNTVWRVEPDPDREIRSFFWKRFVSFIMILAVALLLLLSLMVTMAVSAVSQYLPAAGWSGPLLQWTETGVSFVVIALVLALVYKTLPDARVAWRDVYVGGAVTALLFNGGKLLIGTYLRQSSVTNVYGAAGSLAVVLIWTYYVSMIFLLGAEFTQVWAERSGRHIRPVVGAVHVRRQAIKAAR
jgi:membrane protein